MSRRKPFSKPKKSFKISTLIWLMFFFLFMGSVGLPYLNTQRFDAENPPPPTFPIATGSAGHNSAPYLVSYADFENNYDISRVWDTNKSFSYQHLDAEVKRQAKNLYELKFKSDIYTQSFRYRVDEANKKVVPISSKTTGLLIWMYALVCLLIATILIAVGQWLRFWWKTSFD